MDHAEPETNAVVDKPLGEKARQATRCPHCGQRFSPDARFCPFDSEPLVSAEDWDPNGDPLLDTVVDSRYALEAVIGVGGMGTVYRVRHVQLEKCFALKALRPDLARDKETAARFIQEARTAASVSHPSLAQISDFGKLPTGQPYFVMELLEGMPLSALLRRHGLLPPARAVSIARKIAEALHVVHEAGIIHRDLKPDNVHVRPSAGGDDVKIVDFGLAKIMGERGLTREGVVFGTPHYMSPEQAAGEAIDHRADIYALGVLFYEMLTGRLPFEGNTYMAVLSKHIYDEPVPPSELVELGIDGLERVVLRCLEKRASARYATLVEFAAALDRLSRGQPDPAPRAQSTDAVELAARDSVEVVRFRRRVPGWVYGVTAMIVSAAFGALLIVTLFGPSAPPPAPAADTARAAVTLPAPPAAVPVAPPPGASAVGAPRAADSLPPPATVKSAAAAETPRPRPAKSRPRSAPAASTAASDLHERSASGIVDPWAASN